MSFDEIKSLLDKGEYDGALIKIDLSHEDKIQLQILKSIVLRHKSMFGIALNEIQDALSSARKSQNKIYEMSSLIQQTYLYMVLAKPRKMIEDSMSEFEELWTKLNATMKENEEIREIEGYYLHLLAWTYTRFVDAAKAIPLYENCLQIRKQLKYKFEMLYTLNNISYNYFMVGEYDSCFESAKEILTLCEKLDNKIGLNIVYARFADYYIIKGEYVKAKDSINKQLEICKENGLRYFEAAGYFGLGDIQYKEGDYDQALKHYSKSLSLNQDLELPMYECFSLYGLVLTSVKLGAENLVNNYMGKLETVSDSNDNPSMRVHKQLARAIINKNHPRSKFKLQAQEMFEDIIDQSHVFFGQKLVAMLHLAELILDEFKLYGKEEVLSEVKDLTTRIYEMAQEHHLFYEMVHILILQAKLAFMELELDTANKILLQAHLIAEERGLNHLNAEIEIEERKIEHEIGLAMEISKLASPTQERLEKSKIIDYLVQMQKLVQKRQ